MAGLCPWVDLKKMRHIHAEIYTEPVEDPVLQLPGAPVTWAFVPAGGSPRP
jgi:hypothetical protein